MKFHPLAAAMLLCACAPSEDPDNAAASANAADPQDVPILNGAPAPGTAPQQPGSGQIAPDETGEIELTASPNSVSQGGTVTLTLTNGSDQGVGYNLCTSALQTAAGADVQTDRICTMELRTVEPGQSATYAYELPADLETGSYRLSTSVTRMASDTQATVSTGPFEVTAR